MSDLQEDIEVGDSAITGTLKYVTGYTGFSSKTAERSGNYLALHCDVPGMDGATITVEVVGGTSGPTVLDDDRVIVCRIASTEQSIRVTASMDGWDTITRTYGLADLDLAVS